MNISWRPSLLAGSLCALAALLAGCSAGSGKSFGGKAGNQSSLEPDAVITVIGHVPAPDGTVYVRSGAEVVLSSKDSNGNDSAIQGVAWTPLNVAAQGVKMIERGATAMSFRAPQPAGDTPLELRFGLEVTAGDGDTDSTEVRVLVSRVPDPNDFLLSDATTTNEAVNVVLVASSYTGAADFINSLGRDAEFTIQVQKQVRYKRAINTGPNPSASPAANDPLYCLSTDPLFTCVKIGAPLLINGSWKQFAGVSGTSITFLGSTFPLTRNGNLGTPYQNPRFRLRPPSLNADEVNFAVLTNGILTNFNGTGVPPSDARRNNLLYTADIDTAEAEYVITMTSADLGSTGRRADLLVFAADATAPTTLSFLGEGLAATSADPGMVTITGTQALDGIKAAPGVVESRTTAQAYYAAIDPGNLRTNLDDWLNDNCMQRELAGPPGYYGSDIHSTYLNDRDLGFGREMYFKTDCTTAQRSATGATINTVGGERASIVFNYSSLEGAIKRSGSFLAVAMEYRADASGGPKYTRFYTFAPDPRTREWKRVASANFDGRRERYTPGNCTVCHGGKPKASYTPATPGGGDLGGTFIPWDLNALLFADTDQSVVDERLKPGFTLVDQLPNIHQLNQFGVAPIVDSRIAETQPTGETLNRWNAVRALLQGWAPPVMPTTPALSAAVFNYVPTGWRGLTSPGNTGLSSETLYGKVIAPNCRMCHLQRIADAGAGGLAAATAPQFGAYADTYFSGINASKTRLRVFEQHVMPGSRLTADRFWIQQPGDALPAAKLLADHLDIDAPADVPAVAAVAAPQTEVDPGTAGIAVRLSGLQSRYASTYSWTLQRPAGSNAVLVGANTAEPGFLADASGNYLANLTVTDINGNNSTLAAPVTIVADRRPTAGSYAVNPNSGAAVAINLFAVVGGASPGDGANSITILSQLPGNSGALNVNNCVTSCTVNFTATASGAIQYRITDADGDTADGVINVSVAVPGNWNVNPGNIFNPNLYAFSCTAGSCSSVSLGINATALAQNALGLTPTQFTQAGYTATATIIASPTRRGRNTAGTLGAGPTGSASAFSTSMFYTAPTLFVSAQGGASLTDSFQFRITVNQAGNPNNPVSTSQDGTVQMTVNPRYQWSQVYSRLGTLCSSCHTAARDATRGWGSLGVGDGTTTYNDLLTTSAVNGSGCAADTTDKNNGAGACVSFSNIANSLLLLKPQGSFLHYLGTSPGYTVPGFTATDVANFEDWIRDGAYRN
jgi:hypothetical protein